MPDLTARTERWLPIPDFEGIYEVSNYGRVRSLNRIILTSDRRKLHLKGRIKKPTPNIKSGHLLIMLWKDNVQYPKFVHQLVSAVFIGPCPPGQETRHKDSNPMNNNDWNLHYGTRSDNMQDMVKAGRNHHQNQYTKRARITQLGGESNS